MASSRESSGCRIVDGRRCSSLAPAGKALYNRLRKVSTDYEPVNLS